MAQEPVPPQVLQWYGWFYSQPMGRIEEAIQQQEQGLKADPLNAIARITLAWSLLTAGRLAEAQKEAHKVMELEENHPWVSWIFALTYARQEKWSEALSYAEKGYPMIPLLLGTLAGVLRCMGEDERASKSIQELLPGKAYGAPLGLCFFHLLCQETDKAADWLEKALSQRDPLAVGLALRQFQGSSQWDDLAKLVNLPEEAR